MCYMYANVCMWIGAARGPLRANPHGKTSPARLHRSFASSRCFITMALGSPLAIHLPLPLLNWHGWRRCPIESWMKLYRVARRRPRESRLSRSENLLIVIPPENSPQKSASGFSFFVMRTFHPGSTSQIGFLARFHENIAVFA